MSPGNGQLLLTSSARPMELRMRPDLVCVQARYQSVRYWLVKDPVGLRYFRFQEEEFELLRLLDGQHSLDEIKDEFESRFPPQKISVEELQRFIGHLHSSGLVISNRPGQGEKLLERANKRRRQRRLQAMANILFFKLPGFDPERLLTRLYPYVRWFFTPAGLWGAVALMLAALLLVTINFETFRSQPEFERFANFFNIYNMVWLWVALGVAKIIHEFGHGLTCKHFRGECHEMGVLFLVLTPCLYCNVSDSWMMPNKWHRIAISAAGIYVEVVLASLATFVWWYTGPGMLHNLAFSTMFVCSVSTVLFNANPLLRYDGYYIMMDLLEIPNLRTKSTMLLQRTFAKWCLGMETPDDPFMPRSRRWMFVTYAIASYLYRWFVTFAILWFLYHFLGTLPEPWNKLQSLSWLLASAAIGTLVIVPSYQLIKFLATPGRISEVNKMRMTVSTGIAAAVIAAFLFVPLPLRVRCGLTIEPQGEEIIYVTRSGILQQAYVDAGQTVTKDQKLAQLINLDMDLEIEKIREQLEVQQHLVQTYRTLGEVAQMQEAQEALKGLEEQLQERLDEQKQLCLVAPRDGVVIPPPMVPTPDTDQQHRVLPTWHRTPLEPQNQGAFLETGVTFCSIASPNSWEAQLVVDQADYEYVRLGRKVWIKLDELAGQTLEGRVEEIAPIDLEVAPPQLTTKAGGEMPTRTGPGGIEQPMSAYYLVRVPLEDQQGLLRPGFRGRAKIAAGTRTYGQWLWRFLTRTFHFRM